MATLSDLYTHLKTLCEQWFYNKSTVDTYLNNKVDKENGKGLSTNDYTTAEKTKLSGIEAQANKTTVDSALSSTSTNPLQNKAINTALSSKADSSDIPTKTSDLTNDGADGTNVFVADNDSRLSDARTPTSHTHGQVTNDGRIGANAVTIAPSDKIVITDDSASSIMARVDTILSSHMSHPSSLANIGTSANASQASINSAIDTAIGTLSSIQAIQVVSALPTASSSTLGKLYIVSESSKVNVYYTEESSGSYAWHKMDTDILDELSIDWEDIENKPSSFTPSSHSHGFITNDGKLNCLSARTTSDDYVVFVDSSANNLIRKADTLSSDLVRDSNDYSYIGSDSSQTSINVKINSEISALHTSVNGKASSSHSHGNILNGGTITQTGTNGGNLVVTNSNDEIIVESAIDVLDGVIQALISYGAS